MKHGIVSPKLEAVCSNSTSDRRDRVRGLSVWLLGLCAVTLGSCSPTTPKLVPPRTEKTEQVTDVSDTKVTFSRDLDILFVIDDSGSMAGHQQNLAKNSQLFTQGIIANQILDYQIGVLTSNMDDPPWRPVPGYGWKGELHGTTKFVNRKTVGGASILEQNMKPGTDGSASEMFFSPVQAALTPPNLQGANRGFYRPQAHLAIIFVTDSDDQSSLSAADLHKFLLQLKQNDPAKIIVYGVHVPSNVRGCERSGEPEPRKLEEFFRLTKAQTFSLCEPDFGVKLAALGADLVRKVGSVLYLTRAPQPQTIVVTFGSQVIPNDVKKGWVYDPTRNALVMGEDLDLKPEPPGTQVQVSFTAANY